MLVEKSSDPWFALCVGAVIVSTVQSIFSRLDSSVFTVAMLAAFFVLQVSLLISLCTMPLQKWRQVSLH